MKIIQITSILSFTLSEIFSRYSLIQCAFPSLGKPNTQLFASSSDLFTWVTALYLKKLYFKTAKAFSNGTQIISIGKRTELGGVQFGL